NVLRQVALPYRLTLRPAIMLASLFTPRGARLGFESPGGAFDRCTHAARLRCPLLVLHGELDSVCPLDDGLLITASSRQSRLQVIPGAGHLDLWSNPAHAAICTAAVRDLLAGIKS
ncbi:MAG: hypothetical protein H7Y88_09400, partial [Phycisphaerales bacterium]|nr:hypothetical protein [Phycisphaerales bacterium]